MMKLLTTSSLFCFLVTTLFCFTANSIHDTPPYYKALFNHFVVSLECPPSPEVNGSESETILVNVGANSGFFATGDGSINFPAGIYSNIPATAININVELSTTVETFSGSILNEITIDIEAPGTTADATGYAPSSSSTAGIETDIQNYGDFDPTGTWDFTIFDTQNDNGSALDAEVTFIVTLTWTVPPIPSDCDVTVCNDDSYTLDTQLPGLTYNWSTMETTQSIVVTESGTYTVTVTDGVETSIDDIVVTFNTSEEEIFPVICNGDVFNVGSSNYTTPGTYTDVLTNYLGCDSTVTTNLTVVSNITEETFPSICAGQTYSVGTSNYTSSGTFTDVLTSYLGCDSTITTNLTVSTSINVTNEETLCPGQSVTVGTSTYSTAGTFTDMFVTPSGCDSTVTTIVTLSDSYNEEVFKTICFGESYEVGSSSYNATGVYTDMLTTAENCDSIITTNLVVLGEIIVNNPHVLCQGQSVTVGGNVYNSTGIFTDVFTSYLGCDSTIITDLTINNHSTFEQDAQFCNGGSVTVGMNTYTTPGVYTDVLTNSLGCDSTITTTVIVVSEIIEEQEAIFCPGGSVTVGMNTYTSPGVYNDLFVSSGGCDSTMITTVTVLTDEVFEQTIPLCTGESVDVGTNTYSANGVYTDNLLTFFGCDSTVITTVIINPSGQYNFDANICQGETHEVGTSSYNATGVYIDNLVSDSGCDSIVITNLVVSNMIETNEQILLCSGATYNGTVYTSDDTIIENLTSIAGCDSTHTTFIVIDNSMAVTVNTQDDNCSSQSGTAIANTTGGQQPYTFLWDNGYFLQLQDDLLSGTYTVTVTDANGCTASGQGTISSTTGIDASIFASNLNCNNDASGAIDLQINSGTPPYTYQWNSSNGLSASSEDLNNLDAATYSLIVQDANGCEFNTSVVITEPELFAVSVSQNSNGFAISMVSGGVQPYTYSWSNGETTAAIFADPGTYTLNVTDANGCVESAQITLTSQNNIEGLQSFNLSPNPNNGTFNINLNTIDNLDFSIDVYNIIGQKVFTQVIRNTSSFEKNIQLEHISSGTYFLMIQTEKGRIIEKFIVE